MKKRITATLLAVFMMICIFAGCTAKNGSQLPEDAFIGTWAIENAMSLRFTKGDAQYKFVLAFEGMGEEEGIYTATATELTLTYASGGAETLSYAFEDGALVVNGTMVFERTSGAVNTDKLSASQILIYSVVGFAVVFAVLLVLFVVITVQGRIFDKTAKSKVTIKDIVNTAIGDEVVLVNTDEETAAMIMAIVADETGIPIEELYFKSIKLVEEGEEADEIRSNVEE